MERSKKPSAIPVSPTVPTPQVSISQDNARVAASLPTGESIEVLLYGATVISWKSAKGKDNLFLSSKAHLDGSRPVRGGIPLVFPVFGPPPSSGHATSGLPQHGFARTSKWEYLGKSSSESSATSSNNGDASVKLDFGLSHTMLDKIPSEWQNYQFGITYSVTLNREDLETSLAIRNTGEKDWEFQTLFHTYLAVDDISQVAVSGLESTAYKDKTQGGKTMNGESGAITISGEVDRAYSSDPAQPIVVAEKNKPKYEITRDLLSDVVIWNPWVEKAKGMADFRPEDGYKKMICVEAGSVAAWNTLEAGDTWEGADPADVAKPRSRLHFSLECGLRPASFDHGVGLHDFAGQSPEQQQPLPTKGTGPLHDGDEHSDLTGERDIPRAQRPHLLPRPSSIARRASFIDEVEAPPPTSLRPAKTAPVSWSDLPNKRQLAIPTMARLSEPLTQTSLQAYMFYQLRSFDPTLPDFTIASQAGMLQGSFTAAQFVTAILWGRMADSEKMDRKGVLLIGLFGTCISCLGFGFSRSFVQAAVFRTLGGALNGNVGVMRTMISEIIHEKRFQSRAFLLLPMCFNIGVIIGPVLGGLLSDPVASYPSVFGDSSLFGGKGGVWWLKHWPYALPNLTSALLLFISATGVTFGLEETLNSLRDRPDFGLRLGHSIANMFRRVFRTRTHRYTVINADDTLDSPSSCSHIDSYELESRLPKPPATPTTSNRKLAKLPLSRIWTRNVLNTLLCHCILALHIGTFNNLWFIHLSTPRFDPSRPSPASHTSQRLPFSFTGGLGMPPRSVGFAMAVLGVIGISLQLLVYPAVNAKLGTIRSFRYSLCLFPLAYTLAPYLSIIPSSTPAPNQASGFLVWLSITCVLLIQVVARTFALPATVILINNCSPHPSVLGNIHGIAQSVSSASRTLGPVLGGWGFGKGLEIGAVGMVWWSLAVVACVGWCVSSLLREGSGHEILLDGEEDEERMGAEDLEGRGRHGARPGFVKETTGAALK